MNRGTRPQPRHPKLTNAAASDSDPSARGGATSSSSRGLYQALRGSGALRGRGRGRGGRGMTRASGETGTGGGEGAGGAGGVRGGTTSAAQQQRGSMNRQWVRNEHDRRLESVTGTMRASLFDSGYVEDTDEFAVSGETIAAVTPAVAAPITVQEREKRFSHVPHMNRYNELKNLRQAERELAIAQGKIADPNKQMRLEEAVTFVGECQDMCPEYEREEREFQNGLDKYEKLEGTNRVDHERAVKAYHRPAAGNEQALPSDVRPPPVLKRTLDYLFNEIVSDSAASLEDSHAFVRDRTRSIRQDFTLQNIRDTDAIEVHERVARYHILCLHQLADAKGFEVQQELEQLKKVLQSITEFYDDHNRFSVVTPNEPEFRAYYIVMHLRDQDMVRQAQLLPLKVFSHPLVQRALEFHSLAQRNNEIAATASRRNRPPNCEAAQNFYSRFFKLVAHPTTPYLMACLLEAHFSDVRKGALKAMNRAYLSLYNGFPLRSLVEALGFDDEVEAGANVECYGLEIAVSGEEPVVKFGVKDEKTKKVVWFEPLSNPPLKKSERLVEPKRVNLSNLDIIYASEIHNSKAPVAGSQRIAPSVPSVLMPSSISVPSPSATRPPSAQVGQSSAPSVQAGFSGQTPGVRAGQTFVTLPVQPGGPQPLPVALAPGVPSAFTFNLAKIKEMSGQQDLSIPSSKPAVTPAITPWPTQPQPTAASQILPFKPPSQVPPPQPQLPLTLQLAATPPAFSSVPPSLPVSVMWPAQHQTKSVEPTRPVPSPAPTIPALLPPPPPPPPPKYTDAILHELIDALISDEVEQQTLHALAVARADLEAARARRRALISQLSVMILMDDLVPSVAHEAAAEVTADLARETRCKRQVFDAWVRKRNEWRRRREEFEKRMMRFERDVGGLGIASPMIGGVRRQAREFGGRRRKSTSSVGSAEEVEDVMIRMERVRVGEEGWDEGLVRAVDEATRINRLFTPLDFAPRVRPIIERKFAEADWVAGAESINTKWRALISLSRAESPMLFQWVKEKFAMTTNEEEAVVAVDWGEEVDLVVQLVDEGWDGEGKDMGEIAGVIYQLSTIGSDIEIDNHFLAEYWSKECARFEDFIARLQPATNNETTLAVPVLFIYWPSKSVETEVITDQIFGRLKLSALTKRGHIMAFRTLVMEEVEKLDEDLLGELEWLANSTVIRVVREKTVEFDDVAHEFSKVYEWVIQRVMKLSLPLGEATRNEHDGAASLITTVFNMEIDYLASLYAAQAGDESEVAGLFDRYKLPPLYHMAAGSGRNVVGAVWETYRDYLGEMVYNSDDDEGRAHLLLITDLHHIFHTFTNVYATFPFDMVFSRIAAYLLTLLAHGIANSGFKLVKSPGIELALDRFKVAVHENVVSWESKLRSVKMDEIDEVGSLVDIIMDGLKKKRKLPELVVTMNGTLKKPKSRLSSSLLSVPVTPSPFVPSGSPPLLGTPSRFGTPSPLALSPSPSPFASPSASSLTPRGLKSRPSDFSAQIAALMNATSNAYSEMEIQY